MMKFLHFFAVLVFLGSFLFDSGLHGQELISGSKAVSIEDFETGDFSQYDWEFGGNADWTITDVNPYEGTYSARSGIITNSQTSSLSLTYQVYAQDTLSFWYKVSSESGYDFLTFYVDGSPMDEWSGTVPWSQAIFVIDVGLHTFTWEYNKDFSVSTGEDACWIDYIIFPPEEIEANFAADTTVICQGDAVFFTDLSIGPVTQWNWTFEGGTPSTSTAQNPVIGYGTSGNFDVLLEVSDGIESSTLYMPEYIHVGHVPQTANTPTGISYLCASWGNSTYNTAPLSGVTTYDWTIEPSEAGTISGSGTNVTVVWASGFLGTADLSVAGINYCGVGSPSEPLSITRYLPDVNLVLPAYVGLPEPPFELTGGTPAGGEYSGPGVSNGMFDPQAAGLGEHTITYTYTDPNLCTGTAQDVITVTQFIGINSYAQEKDFSIYPNPTAGHFTVKIHAVPGDHATVKLFNTLNETIYEESNIFIGNDTEREIDLSGFSKGLYFLRVTCEKYDTMRKVLVK